MTSAAVFLDRDGTIVEDRGYMGDPEQLRLIPGAADALRRFSREGYLVIVVSNQSGVARGLFDEAALARVHARLEGLLEECGAGLDGAYYCPYLSGAEATVGAYRRESELRKPAPGMLLQAAGELDIDLSRSWMIGDAACDVEAGARAGCRTIFICPDGSGDDQDVTATYTVSSLAEAADTLERNMAREGKDTPDAAGLCNDDAVRLLGEIRDQLDRARREERQLDFSFLRLSAALLQMIAVVVALWGAAALFDEQAAAATARFTLACFLQLASISAFALSRFR
jgi:D-glycero-D-manno-heptose 1,7-bisphosphate phosphatase